ncbi:MAG: SulP family inorganic anion transporter [Xanthobacteraceae bacterium]|nr:SulP family inorganic anion transporter [Xanthobacteraceae bacterium]
MTGKASRQAWLFPSLRGYALAMLPTDALAALVLTAIALLGQLATAKLMHLSPMAGLLAFAAGSFAFAALGSNRFASVASDSTIAPIMAGSLALMVMPENPHYAALAATLALLVGAILLLAGVLRAGWIADLLSVPVTTGFLVGIAVHIIIGQLPTVFGVSVKPDQHVLGRFLELMLRLPDAKAIPLVIGFGVLACTLIAEWLNPRIPGSLIGLVASGLAVWWFGFNHNQVAVLGALPLTPPTVAMSLPKWSEFTQLLQLAVTVALVCMMQTAAVVRSFPSDPTQAENVSRDFAGVGAGSILAGLLGSFAVDASPPSTAAVVESGGRSQACSLLAILIIAVIVLFAGGLFSFVPEAALAGVLMFIALRICRIDTIRKIYLNGGMETLLVIASAALVVIMPIQAGVAMSIGLSLLHSLYIVARPDSAVLARVPHTTIWWNLLPEAPGEHEPGVLVFAPGAPINFTNAYYIRDKLQAAIAKLPEPCRLVVLEANGVIDFDFTGADIMQQMITELRSQGTDVVLARLESEIARHAAERAGLLALLGPDHVFRSVEDAIQAFRARSKQQENTA